MVASDDVDTRFVWFPGGMVVPAPAYILLLDLEARGFTLSQEHTTLVVRPPERLTRQDCQALRRWKLHLLMLMAYRPDQAMVADVPRSWAALHSTQRPA
jgi:hypothetical protein